MSRSMWSSVLRRTFLLLGVWFLVGPVLGILVVDRLNAIQVNGVPFGFWVAQQGSILVFVVLIFLNAWITQRNARAEDPPATAPHGRGEH